MLVTVLTKESQILWSHQLPYEARSRLGLLEATPGKPVRLRVNGHLVHFMLTEELEHRRGFLASGAGSTAWSKLPIGSVVEITDESTVLPSRSKPSSSEAGLHELHGHDNIPGLLSKLARLSGWTRVAILLWFPWTFFAWSYVDAHARRWDDGDLIVFLLLVLVVPSFSYFGVRWVRDGFSNSEKGPFLTLKSEIRGLAREVAQVSARSYLLTKHRIADEFCRLCLERPHLEEVQLCADCLNSLRAKIHLGVARERF